MGGRRRIRKFKKKIKKKRKRKSGKTERRSGETSNGDFFPSKLLNEMKTNKRGSWEGSRAGGPLGFCVLFVLSDFVVFWGGIGEEIEVCIAGGRGNGFFSSLSLEKFRNVFV